MSITVQIPGENDMFFVGENAKHFLPEAKKYSLDIRKSFKKYETFPKINVSSNCPEGHVEDSSDNLTGNFPRNVQKSMVKIFFKFFPQNAYMDTWNALGTTAAKPFWKKLANFPVIYQKKLKKKLHKSTYVSSRFFYGHVECSFHNPNPHPPPPPPLLRTFYDRNHFAQWPKISQITNNFNLIIFPQKVPMWT